MREETPLTEWMNRQVGKGPGFAFRSLRQWSIKAGLNPNRAGQVAEQGTARRETLRKLAKPAKVEPEYLYELAGLPLEDVHDEEPTDREWDVLEDLRALSREQPAVHSSVIEHIRQLRERLARSAR